MNHFTKDKGLFTIGKFHCYSSVINMLTVSVGDEVPLTIGAALLLVAETFSCLRVFFTLQEKMYTTRRQRFKELCNLDRSNNINIYIFYLDSLLLLLKAQKIDVDHVLKCNILLPTANLQIFPSQGRSHMYMYFRIGEPGMKLHA